jgi:hypothetical protein
VILPHTPRAQAAVVIRRLEAPLSSRGPEFGVAQLSRDETTVEALLAAARADLHTRANALAGYPNAA